MKARILKIVKSLRPAIVLSVLAGLIVLIGGSSAYAAQTNALPGSPLYPLKQIWEEGSLLLSFSPAAKAQVHLNIAQDRIKATQANLIPAPILVPTLQTVHQNLNDALSQSNQVSDPAKRQEIKNNISDAASAAEQTAEHATEAPESSTTDKQDIKSTSDQIKQVQDKASTND